MKHHTWFISLNSALRPSSDPVLHMSPIECTEKSPLFSLISIRFGSCDEVRRLNLALVGREKQQTTKGQKKREKNLKKSLVGWFPLWSMCTVSSTRRRSLQFLCFVVESVKFCDEQKTWVFFLSTCDVKPSWDTKLFIIRWIEIKKSMASESLTNGYLKLELLSRSSCLAQPWTSALKPF